MTFLTAKILAKIFSVLYKKKKFYSILKSIYKGLTNSEEKMKKIILSAAAVAMLAGCTDNIVTASDDAKSKSKITLNIVDHESNAAIAGAEVRTQSAKDAKVADEDGYVIFEKNEIGSYIFEVSKDGYATIRTHVIVPETGANDVPRVPDLAEQILMYKTGVTLSGFVYYTDSETGNLVPAKGATVILSYDEAPIVPASIEVTTGKDGSYKFEDLAEKTSYEIEVVKLTIDSKVYSVNSTLVGVTSRVGTTENKEKIVLSQEGVSPSLLATNFSSMDVDKDVELTFDMKLAGDSLNGKWSVSRDGKSILVEPSLKKDGKTIVLSPVSGSWSKDVSYHIVGKAYSEDGFSSPVDETFSFGTVSKPKHVSDLKVKVDSTDYDEDYDDEYNYDYNLMLKLTWKAPSGSVEGYHIYFKTDDMDDYEYFENVEDTQYAVYLGSLSTAILNAEKVSFIVLPYNGAGSPKAADAKPVSWTVVKL